MLPKNSKDLIVLFLTVMVFLVVILPVVGAVIGAIRHGEPVTQPEFLKTVGGIVSYILGIISGYVLNTSNVPPPDDKPKA